MFYVYVTNEHMTKQTYTSTHSPQTQHTHSLSCAAQKAEKCGKRMEHILIVFMHTSSHTFTHEHEPMGA